ncbi:glutathione S-transferase [Obelidium mucronatum]|nr:glutathione S-transferase [Obelidium mucronatum]
MPSVLGNEKPVLTWWDIPGGGRGEAIRLLFADAEIDYVDNRFNKAESDWDTKKAELIKSGTNYYGALPLLEIDGTVLTQHVPILRYIAKKIGKYGGSTDEEAYKLDQFSDVITDWRFSFRSNPETIPRFYNTFENLLKGPFVLGEDFSYADALLYQALFDGKSLGNEEQLAPYPRLRKFVDAFEARPKIAKYLVQRKEKFGA